MDFYDSYGLVLLCVCVCTRAHALACVLCVCEVGSSNCEWHCQFLSDFWKYILFTSLHRYRLCSVMCLPWQQQIRCCFLLLLLLFLLFFCLFCCCCWWCNCVWISVGADCEDSGKRFLNHGRSFPLPPCTYTIRDILTFSYCTVSQCILLSCKDGYKCGAFPLIFYLVKELALC